MKIKKVDRDNIFVEGDNIFCAPENRNVLSVLDQKYVSLGKICYTFFPRKGSVSDMCNTFFPREMTFSDMCERDGVSPDGVCTITSEDVLECFQACFRAIKCGHIKNNGLFAEQDVINEEEASWNTMLYCYKAILLMIRAKLLPDGIYFFLKKAMIRGGTLNEN